MDHYQAFMLYHNNKTVDTYKKTTTSVAETLQKQRNVQLLTSLCLCLSRSLEFTNCQTCHTQTVIFEKNKTV